MPWNKKQVGRKTKIKGDGVKRTTEKIKTAEKQNWKKTNPSKKKGNVGRPTRT